jgi:hypothetical protein
MESILRMTLGIGKDPMKPSDGNVRRGLEAVDVLEFDIWEQLGDFLQRLHVAERGCEDQLVAIGGKRIGVPVFDMAAAVWLRGIFQDHFGLSRTSPIYVAGGLEAARSGDEHPQFYPHHFKHERRNDKSLAVLVAEGEIDALYTARAPSTWPSTSVSRLFADPMRAELDYFSKTKIFPPMHVIAVKRKLAEANPGLTLAIFNAFAQAQKNCQGKTVRLGRLVHDVAVAARKSHCYRAAAWQGLLAGGPREEPRDASSHHSLHDRRWPDRECSFTRGIVFRRGHLGNIERSFVARCFFPKGMQAARDGERSQRRNDRSADVGFHEFKQVLDRSAHANASELAHWPKVLESLGHKYCFSFNGLMSA